MIHLVVALGPEAAGLAEIFGLRRARSADEPFPLFTGADARLVVSGVGRTRAAEATAHLRSRFDDQAAVWLNVGVAAHRDLPLGSVVVAHKVEEEATSGVWYPGLVAEPELPTATVRTVDRPIAAPADAAVYEMEASGFLATALGWTTSGAVAVIKVISDHGVEAPARLGRAEVKGLLAASAAAVRTHAEAMAAVVERRRPVWRGDFLDSWSERCRLTFSERHRLARLANRAAALGVAREELDGIRASDAGELLERLRAQLDAAAMERR